MRVACLLLALHAAAAAQDTILEIALEVARRDHPALAKASERDLVRAEIGRLAGRYRELVAAAKTPAERADAFRRLLFDEEKFEAIKELDSAEHLHVDTVLKRRKGYCLSLSIVALAVAEEAGAPLYGVAMPNHFLVRYDDGTYRHNLELTRKGVRVTDKDLRKQLGRLDDVSIYARNLKRSDIKAYLLHNRGYVALLRKQRDLARSDFEAAIKLQPGLGEAHRNLGVVYGEQRRWQDAKRAFGRAIALYPKDINALINLAICRHALGDRAAAIQDLEMALALDPGRARAEDLLRRWKEEKVDEIAAEKLPPAPEGLKPGLFGRYYAGLNFRLLKAERVDRNIDFDWQNGAPSPELPRDRFSTRWEGYLKAPRTGTYTFFVVANDGVRLFVGKDTVLDNWKDMGFRNWYGTKDVRLAAGWHRIRIEHYDVFGGARILLRVGVEGRKLPLELKDHLFHVPQKTEKTPDR